MLLLLSVILNIQCSFPQHPFFQNSTLYNPLYYGNPYVMSLQRINHHVSTQVPGYPLNVENDNFMHLVPLNPFCFQNGMISVNAYFQNLQYYQHNNTVQSIRGQFISPQVLPDSLRNEGQNVIIRIERQSVRYHPYRKATQSAQILHNSSIIQHVHSNTSNDKKLFYCFLNCSDNIKLFKDNHLQDFHYVFKNNSCEGFFVKNIFVADIINNLLNSKGNVSIENLLGIFKKGIFFHHYKYELSYLGLFHILEVIMNIEEKEYKNFIKISSLRKEIDNLIEEILERNVSYSNIYMYYKFTNLVLLNKYVLQKIRSRTENDKYKNIFSIFWIIENINFILLQHSEHSRNVSKTDKTDPSFTEIGCKIYLPKYTFTDSYDLIRMFSIKLFELLGESNFFVNYFEITKRIFCYKKEENAFLLTTQENCALKVFYDVYFLLSNESKIVLIDSLKESFANCYKRLGIKTIDNNVLLNLKNFEKSDQQKVFRFYDDLINVYCKIIIEHFFIDEKDFEKYNSILIKINQWIFEQKEKNNLI